MTVEQAGNSSTPSRSSRASCKTLVDVGLYITLGQSATTFPAARRNRSNWPWNSPSATPAAPCTSWTEPTTGLHFADIELLLTVAIASPTMAIRWW